MNQSNFISQTTARLNCLNQDYDIIKCVIIAHFRELRTPELII